jgi:deferrochelatase/peroxidase EfeB
MKKILLLSVLILFSCSKDTLVPANSGNKIIGSYQLVQQISVEQAEFSVWAASSPTTVTGRTNVTGKVIFPPIQQVILT